MADAHQKQLEVTLRKIASEHKYENCEIELKPIPGDGASYSSKLFFGRITAAGKDDLKIFAKVALFNESMRLLLSTNAYLTEQYFYSTIADSFKKLQDKYKVPKEERLRIPKIYGYDATEFNEVIVLEDLVAEGFTVHDRYKSFNWEYATAAVQQLARLHALSIALELKHTLIMSTKDYERIKDIIKTDFTVITILKHTKNVVEKMTELVKEENRGSVQNYLAKTYPKIMDGIISGTSQKVLVHNEFRTGNIMHKVEKDGKIHLIPVDYQTLMFGCPVIDLIYLIFTGSASEFRRYHFRPILDYYHDQLSLSLARLELDAAELYPKQEFNTKLEELFGLGLIFALLVIPVMTADKENVPKQDECFSLESLATVPASQLCSDRLNEVVDDYVAWGIL